MSTPPTGGGNFIKATDVQLGDTAVIKTEADWMETKFTKEDGTKQMQYVCVVDYKGEDRKLKLTIASCDELKALGTNSEDWIGKKVEFEVVKVMVGGSMKNSIFVTPYGSGVDQTQSPVPNQPASEGQPQTQAVPAGTVEPQPPKYDADGNEIAWDE